MHNTIHDTYQVQSPHLSLVLAKEHITLRIRDPAAITTPRQPLRLLTTRVPARVCPPRAYNVVASAKPHILSISAFALQVMVMVTGDTKASHRACADNGQRQATAYRTHLVGTHTSQALRVRLAEQPVARSGHTSDARACAACSLLPART